MNVEKISEVQFNSDHIISPGQMLSNILYNRNIEPYELAEATGYCEGYIENLMEDEVVFTREVAKKLEKVLEVSTSSWLKSEKEYRKLLANQRIRCLRKEIRALETAVKKLRLNTITLEKQTEEDHCWAILCEIISVLDQEQIQ